uniref:VPS37 C-terminal domain-containing protein n=1 Tax=Timema douglasi TaxID=61478 RepID=A0A7R8Z990_TIMDO|nr:unnamed protein product [Timema douglasi]
MLPRIFRTEPDNVASNRKRQIDTLKIFNDNVTEVQEDLEYKVDFLAGGVNMVLLVSLSPDFPLDKPVLKVQPLVIHPWVNDHSEIVSAPGLLNYTVHSDLGRVVQAIISEFSRNPPPVALGNEPQGSLPPLGGSEVSTDQSSSLTRFPQVTGSYLGVYPPQSPVHTVNTLTFPELLDLTTEELRTLNNSEDRQQDWVESMPQCARLNAELDALIECTQELAEENLRKKPELSRLRKETEGKLAAVKSLKNSFDSLSQEFQRRSEIYAPENIRSPCSVPPSPLYPPVSLLSYQFSVDMAVHLVAIYWDVLLVLSLICTVDLDKVGITEFKHMERGRCAVLGALRTFYQGLGSSTLFSASMLFLRQVVRSLQLSALRSDEETESIAEHFLSGDMDVDHFTHLYIDKKMISDSQTGVRGHLSGAVELNTTSALANYATEAGDLIEDFGEYLPENLGKEFWMQDPFSTVEYSTLPNFFSTKEIIELSCDETHTSSLKKTPLADFWLQKLNKFTHIADHAIKFMMPFSTTYF